MNTNRKLMTVTSISLACMTFCMPVYGFNPSKWGKKIHSKIFPAEEPAKQSPAPYKDPLLEYIYPEKIVSPEGCRKFFSHLNKEQMGALWKALKGGDEDVPSDLNVTKLNKELLWASHHWATYLWEKYSGDQLEKIDYTEIVRWTAEKLDVPPAECKYASTFQLEHAICEKILARMWDKLTPEQREKILKESGIAPSNAVAYAALSGSGLIAAIGTSAAVMGFSFYIIMAKTVVIAAAGLGVSVTTTISAVSLLAGPVGWAIAGVCATAGLCMIGRADASKTAAFIIQVHIFKVMAMEKSGVDYKKYLLKQ